MAYLKVQQSLRWRLIVLFIFFLVAFGFILFRVFQLSILGHRTYAAAAEKQHIFSEVLPPERGKIFFQDKNGERYPVALNRNTINVIASPHDVTDPEVASLAIAERLSLDPAALREKLARAGDSYEVIARGISEDAAVALQDLRITGIRFERESHRIYPNDSLGASVLGFVSFDGKTENGEYGIERQFNASLSGKTGFFEGEQGAGGYWVALGKRILHPPTNGADLVLTVDRNIQYQVEEELRKLIEKWQGESAAAVVLDPMSGKIIALASLPAFNPNEYSKEQDYGVFRMPVLDSQFELGSVFKPVTMAAGINEGAVTPTTVYHDFGFVQFGSKTIRNFDGKGNGDQTMTQVLEKSLNTGVVFVERLLKPGVLLDYVKQFGFGEKTGIVFPGEVAGDITNVASGQDIALATSAFGQGIAVTPLQMALAIAAIANGGSLMKPYLVDRIIDDAGNETRIEPEKRRSVIPKETAEKLTKMLVAAVRNGFENHAGVDGYFVAGKTGTAQVPGKGGYTEDVIHTFVGYAPAFHPRFLVLIQLNKPKGNRFAANTLTPAFHNLAEFMLNYYEVPPDEARAVSK